MTLRSKLTLGLSFLFLMTLAISMTGVYQIYRYNDNVKLVLKQNLHSIMFSNNMLQAMESRPVQFDSLQQNLELQQANVTEPGEGSATEKAVSLAQSLRQHPDDAALTEQLRQAILQISSINQNAIIQKNAAASIVAKRAMLTLSIITMVLLSVSIIFIASFPAIVTRPVQMLTAGIRQVSNKHYQTRINISRKDEFGELVTVFNMMAEQLHEYDTSNIKQIKTAKNRIETIINQINDGIIGYDKEQHLIFANSIVKGISEARQQSGQEFLQSILSAPAGSQLCLPYQQDHRVFVKEVFKVSNEQDEMGEVIVLRDVSAVAAFAAAKTKFIAAASHELKTPIASMKMSISLLQDSRTGPLGGEQLELLQSIHEDTERILQISSDLLEFTQQKIAAIPGTSSYQI